MPKLLGAPCASCFTVPIGTTCIRPVYAMPSARSIAVDGDAGGLLLRAGEPALRPFLPDGSGQPIGYRISSTTAS
ncbi:hypothetical protein, partial [Cohnella sp. GbtcB17]|uniref:hypothetical protein n=1 Tax=Cohnella sp. GbtcB17 TaxID=2824762 RepID=UPI001C301994